VKNTYNLWKNRDKDLYKASSLFVDWLHSNHAWTKNDTQPVCQLTAQQPCRKVKNTYNLLKNRGKDVYRANSLFVDWLRSNHASTSKLPHSLSAPNLSHCFFLKQLTAQEPCRKVKNTYNLLKNRGKSAYKANKLMSSKIQSLEQHLDYEAIIQIAEIDDQDLLYLNFDNQALGQHCLNNKNNNNNVNDVNNIINDDNNNNDANKNNSNNNVELIQIAEINDQNLLYLNFDNQALGEELAGIPVTRRTC